MNSLITIVFICVFVVCFVISLLTNGVIKRIAQIAMGLVLATYMGILLVTQLEVWMQMNLGFGIFLVVLVLLMAGWTYAWTRWSPEFKDDNAK